MTRPDSKPGSHLPFCLRGIPLQLTLRHRDLPTGRWRGQSLTHGQYWPSPPVSSWEPGPRLCVSFPPGLRGPQETGTALVSFGPPVPGTEQALSVCK